MQQIVPLQTRSRYRAIWISDVHLGFRGSRADCLLDFLRSVDCETLYLVGDIVDIWQLRRKRYWPQAHNDVIRNILGKARYGTRIVYVPGNHDELMKSYNGHDFGNISIVAKAIHTRATGERVLVVHGDQFDAAVASARWIGTLGGIAYEALLRVNVLVNLVRRGLGFGHWSLAQFLKYRVKNAVRYISRFEEVVAREAGRAGVDGVICGHIHRPEISSIGDIDYYNCGDWVESLTALVEHRDGRIELLAWNEQTAMAELKRAA